MFEVEVIYLTQLGNLKAQYSTSQRVQTREEADELRDVLRKLPALARAEVKIKKAGPPTVDEALDRILGSMREYPPIKD